MKQTNTYIQIRQAGTYYLDNIRMYRTYEDSIFVSGYEVDRAYRYGFGGQEKDNEVSGKGNHYTAPYWEYDPRVVHRWNRDPMSFKYPWQSPYVINNNNPLFYTDPLGLEGEEPKGGGDDDIKMEQDLPGVDVVAKRTEKVIERQISIILELSNPEGADKFRRSEMAYTTARDAMINKKHHYSHTDFYRDYRKYDWANHDPLSVNESYKGQWKSQFDRAIMERNARSPQVIPDAITISISGNASAATGTKTSTSTDFTFILFGDDARFKPYITLTQGFGVSGVSAGGGVSISGSYKSNGFLTKYDLITPFDVIHGNNRLQYFGREVSGNVAFIQGSYTHTPLFEGGFINSYSIGGTLNVRNKNNWRCVCNEYFYYTN